MHPTIAKAIFDVWIDRGEVIQHERFAEMAFLLIFGYNMRCSSCFTVPSTARMVVGAPASSTRRLPKRYLMCGSTAVKLFSMNASQKWHFLLIFGYKMRCSSCFIVSS